MSAIMDLPERPTDHEIASAHARPGAARQPWDLLRVMLVAAVLTSVWRLQDLVPAIAPLRLPTVVLLAVGALLLLSPREQHRLATVSRSLVLRGVLLLLLFAALSVPTSLYVGLSAEYLLLNVAPSVLLAFAAAAAVQDLTDARRVAALQIGGALLYSVVILARYDIGTDGRLGDLVHYDANDIGMLLVCTLPFALYFVARPGNLRRRLLAIASIGVFLLLIVRTGSRGAFLALVVVTAYLLVRSTTVPWRHRLGVLAAIALLLVGSAGSQYWAAMRTMLEPKKDYNWIGNTEAGRMAVWSRGITYMTDRPLTGVGVNAFRVAEGTISPIAQRQMFGGSVKWSSAHSSYVQVGAELGVLGFGVFVAVLLGALVVAGRLARDARRRRAIDISAIARALAASMIGFMVAGAFLSQAYAPFLFVTLGTIVGLDMSTRRAWRAGVTA